MQANQAKQAKDRCSEADDRVAPAARAWTRRGGVLALLAFFFVSISASSSPSETRGGVARPARTNALRRRLPSVPPCEFCGTVVHVQSVEDFDKILLKNTDRLVVVEFARTSCGPCEAVAPRLDELSKKFADTIFLKVVGGKAVKWTLLKDKWRLSSDLRSPSEFGGDVLMEREGVDSVPAFHVWKHKARVEVVTGANMDAVTDVVLKYQGDLVADKE
mmetsp:Transcript_13152/g.39184  ORF Transcript_13152/g.39184 Transcript_13152/m.39184 type:complete len:218 (-) Transcript_13152:20-673(-)